MWAGDIPKDTLTEDNRLKWNDMNTHLVMGKKDELINEEMKAKFLKLVTDYKLDYNSLYDGDHRIYPDVLMELIKSLINGFGSKIIDLEKERTKLFDDLKSLSGEKLNLQIKGEWSINQHLYHTWLVETTTESYIKTKQNILIS